MVWSDWIGASSAQSLDYNSADQLWQNVANVLTDDNNATDTAAALAATEVAGDLVLEFNFGSEASISSIEVYIDASCSTDVSGDSQINKVWLHVTPANEGTLSADSGVPITLGTRAQTTLTFTFSPNQTWQSRYVQISATTPAAKTTNSPEIFYVKMRRNTAGIEPAVRDPEDRVDRIDSRMNRS